MNRIDINTINFEVICRHETDDLDIAEGVDSAARHTAACMADAMDLPHFTVDVKIGEFFCYRENVSALASKL